MRIAIAFAASFAAGALSACGSSLSSGSGDAGDSGNGRDGTIHVEASEPDSRDGSSGPDTTVHDAGGDGDATGEGGHDGAADVRPSDGPSPESADGGVDVVAIDVVEEPDAVTCLPETADPSVGLFAQGGSTGVGSSCGTQSNPCNTIAQAVTNAMGTAGITIIYVGAGPYNEPATIPLPPGITIAGGWDLGWNHNCVAPTVNGPSPIFSASGLSSTTTLDTLDLVVTATPGAGGSLYGVTSSASSLALSNVSITVPPGGAGTDGNPGDAGSAGGDGGCAPAGSGAAGGAGTTGAPGPSGGFSAPPTGFTPGAVAGGGGTGSVGKDGTMGAYGTYVASTCTTLCNDAGPVEGGTGVGGCPGTGGTGGGGATGGGCSIALYAWGGTVTVTGGTLTAGNGGPGGNGGGGGPGGPGEPGITGSSVLYYDDCIKVPPPVPKCTFSGPYYAEGGAPGSNGGSGGKGGQGGGGSGGCSYAYYAGTGATITVTGTTLTHGTGGKGGAPNGVAGPAAAHN